MHQGVPLHCQGGIANSDIMQMVSGKSKQMSFMKLFFISSLIASLCLAISYGFFYVIKELTLHSNSDSGSQYKHQKGNLLAIKCS